MTRDEWIHCLQSTAKYALCLACVSWMLRLFGAK